MSLRKLRNKIGRKIKALRTENRISQEKLAEEINYSLSFISGIESTYHQTFSLGAIWRISRALGVDFAKLCEDDSLSNKSKYINYKCNKCGEETKLPIEMVKLFKDINEITGNKNLPSFDCTKEDCNGKITPTNPMDF